MATKRKFRAPVLPRSLGKGTADNGGAFEDGESVLLSQPMSDGYDNTERTPTKARITADEPLAAVQPAYGSINRTPSNHHAQPAANTSGCQLAGGGITPLAQRTNQARPMQLNYQSSPGAIPPAFAPSNMGAYAHSWPKGSTLPYAHDATGVSASRTSFTPSHASTASNNAQRSGELQARQSKQAQLPLAYQQAVPHPVPFPERPARLQFQTLIVPGSMPDFTAFGIMNLLPPSSELFGRAQRRKPPEWMELTQLITAEQRAAVLSMLRPQAAETIALQENSAKALAMDAERVLADDTWRPDSASSRRFACLEHGWVLLEETCEPKPQKYGATSKRLASNAYAATAEVENALALMSYEEQAREFRLVQSSEQQQRVEVARCSRLRDLDLSSLLAPIAL
eukprot:jgi/Chlat1/4446/Chrsp29S04407